MRILDDAIRALPLKEMDAALLSRAIILEVRRLNRGNYMHISNDDERYIDERVIGDAMTIASYLHRNQTRRARGVFPVAHYIEHPLRNALRLMRYGCWNQDMIVAAILHDTVEDCLAEWLQLAADFETDAELDGREATFMYIQEIFGTRVAELVKAVTNDENPSPDLRTRAEKRADYAEHVKEAIKDPEVALVKFVDFIDNGAGLKHQQGVTDFTMLNHLSQKYLPLVGPFLERVAQDDIRALVNDEQGHADIIEAVTQAGKTLASLSMLR